MAGRRPKPLAMHQLNGNPSQFNKHELSGADNPKPRIEIPEQPRGLSKSAKREWKRIVPELIALGVLSCVDGKALAAYCYCYSRWEEASKLIDKYGQVIETSFEDKNGNVIIGDLKANPACSLADKWMARMKSFLIEFGLTPASRRNLKISKKDNADPMEQFLNRGKKVSVPLLLTPAKTFEPTEEGSVPML